MLSLKEAQETILKAINPLPVLILPLFDAYGLIAAEEVFSPVEVPLFDNSAMDGYALLWEDIKDATWDNPKRLKVLSDLPAGQFTSQKVDKGEAMRIMTGAPIPSGADTVVRVEDTARSDGNVLIRVPPQKGKGANIRHSGEDIIEGERIVEAGKKLTPAILGLMTSVGLATVRVHQRPKVAMLATGDELAMPGETLRPGQIFSSNTITLMGQVRALGADAIDLGLARDTREDLLTSIEIGLDSDLLLTSGGVSVGDYDLVKDVLKELGMEEGLWKIAMKPGKPLVFGVVNDVPVIGLPGNPVSSMVSFIQFAGPAIRKLMGAKNLFPQTMECIVREDIKGKKGLVNLIRVRLSWENNTLFATSTGLQGSGILSSMSLADGLLMIPPDRDKAVEGDVFRVQIINPEFFSA